MITTTTRIKWLKILLGFFLFSLGVTIGIAIRHYNDIPVAETFNIVDVATLITTIFIAVYVPSILDKHLQIRQEKKDIINQRIDDLQLLYKEMNKAIQQQSYSSGNIELLTGNLNILSNRMATIVLLIGYLDAKNNFRDEISEMESLSKKYEKLLLNGEKDSNGVFLPQVRQQEETLFNNMDRVTSLLLFRLSDM
jgi:hypothetical protein